MLWCSGKSCCGCCPPPATGRGAWTWLLLSSPVASHPAQHTTWGESNVQLVFCCRLLLPSGKVCLQGSVFLRMDHPCSLCRSLSPPSAQLCSCKRVDPPPCFRAQIWQRKPQCRNKCPPSPPASASDHLAVSGRQDDGGCQQPSVGILPCPLDNNEAP